MGYYLMPKAIFKFDRAFGFFLSPALGLALSLLFIFLFSRLGFPLRIIKIPFLVFIILIIAFGVFRDVKFQYSFIFLFKLAVAPVGVLLTAWPILRYGFSWLSYVNDDMNNYVLGALRFYDFGFYAKPNNAFFAGRDYSQEFYFWHVLTGVRPGSELYLSTFSNLYHGDVLAIFMPAILTLQMILIFSTLALTRTLKNRSKKGTQLAYVLTVILPLFSLGFLYQLIGQVGGLALGLLCISLITIILQQSKLRDWKSTFVILSCGFAALLIWYPEMLPFIGVPVFLKLLWVKKTQRKAIWSGVAAVCLLAFLFLNKYFFQAIKFAAYQVGATQKSASGANTNSQLFPYFLKPHGIPSFLGAAPLNRWSTDPWESTSVIISAVLLGLLFYLIYKRKLIANLPVAIFLFMFIIFSYLVFTINGFGSFKVAMYSQPFLIVAIASLSESINLQINIRNLKNVVIISGLFLTCFFVVKTSEFYASASTGTSNNGFNEIQNGSSAGIENMIKKATSKYKVSDGVVYSTSMNLSQVKLEAISAQGIPLIFPTTDVFSNFFDSTKTKNKQITRKLIDFRIQGTENAFKQPINIPTVESKPVWYLESNNAFEALNHSKTVRYPFPWNYKLVANPVNTLIFTDSTKGYSYYTFQKSRSEAVIFQPEKNPMFPNTYMQSIGGNLLLEVTNPSKQPYVVMALTTTVIPQYQRLLPQTSLWGKNKEALPLMGRGSARVYVPLVDPISINGHKYFQIHIDLNLLPFPLKLSSISKLYGGNIALDSRRVAFFVSDISVVDYSEIIDTKKPTKINNFPTDLENPDLYYSGIYEDGWVSRDSFFDLDSNGKSNFSISGLVPKLGSIKTFHTVMTISIDGAKAHSLKLPLGHFNETFHIPNLIKTKSLHHVSIHFSNEQILPKPDGRPAAAQISTLGFN
jgi:hypothetical protein